MNILNVTKGQREGEVVVRVMMNDDEFRRLGGHLEKICVFAVPTVTERSTVIRCGARHARVKYLLFPAALRKEYKADPFDFESVKCTAFEDDDELCVVFRITKRTAPPDSLK